MKRTISLILAFVFVFTFVPTFAFSVSALEEGDYTYEIVDGTATITGYHGVGGDVKIPDTLGGVAVTAIGDGAFKGCTSLISLEMPSSVLTIGNEAFMDCIHLTTANLSGELTFIGDFAFYNCSSLSGSVFVSRYVTNIGKDAFAGCKSLQCLEVSASNPKYGVRSYNAIVEFETKTLIWGGKEAVLSEDDIITKIASHAFYGMTELTLVNIPASVTEIEADAFLDSAAVTMIVVPDSYGMQYAIEHEIPYTTYKQGADYYYDVGASTWYEDAALYCYANQFMAGIEDRIFAPEATMTRAQLAEILYNMEGMPETQYAAQFQDVSKEQWFAIPVSWTYQAGIFVGKSENCFDPDTPTTREEIATVLLRYAEYKGVDLNSLNPWWSLQWFKDAGQVDAWALPGMAAMYEHGVIVGKDYLLAPLDATRRCEVATMLHRFMPIILNAQ